jgi:hypothetical protein
MIVTSIALFLAAALFGLYMAARVFGEIRRLGLR